ncbi:hypothetical protein MMOR_00190 [Mycolicibacterium moriokaense]|uniref:Uncharacterized protein n=1 Tax=Mycolicibacterium moriokaense TaxID=39691 RepID=A0AAD1H519_9MYCO|nr:hypothetical protein MMOR_00190 [Mycolicibacterium moriokaense]
MQGLHSGAHRAGALLESEPVTCAQRAVQEPAHRRVELTCEHRERGALGTADEHVATTDVDVVGQLDRHRQRCDGGRALLIEGVDEGDRRTGARRQADDCIADLQRTGGEPAV